jgi:L-fuconolactonase
VISTGNWTTLATEAAAAPVRGAPGSDAPVSELSVGDAPGIDAPAGMPIVDSHQHVWDPSVHAQPWLDSDEALAALRRVFSITELAPQAAAAGVVSTVVIQTITEPGETPELLALARSHPLVAAVVGWADLTTAEVAGALEDLRALPGGEYLAGVRHPLLTEPDADWLDRPDVRRGLAALATAGLSFDLVLQPSQLPSAVRAAASLPELTFVLDHLGNVGVDTGPGLDESWAAPFRDLAALPNTVCKLSGILSVPGRQRAPARLPAGQQAPGPAKPAAMPVDHLRPYVDLALESFGPKRLMFGSDWPVCTLSASYAGVVAAAAELTRELSEPERVAIWAGTARSAYRIPAA